MSDFEEFDLIVIGSGSGNRIPSFMEGWKIALVERDAIFGGTCLNRGCIPSKMFVLPADLVETVRHAATINVDATLNGADWASARDRVFGRIDPIAAGGRQYRASGTPGLTLIEGTAHFIGEKQLDVEGRHITAPNILVAAGSRPVIPPIPGLVETGFYTSDSIMRIDPFPPRLAIIGGGYIACEMAHVFEAFGAKVTLINRSDRLLRGQDDDVSKAFTDIFGQRIDLKLGHVPTGVARRGADIVVTVDGDEVVVDAVLVAAGREPNSDVLAVASGGLTSHGQGIVDVDEYMETNVPGVYAIGDIANHFQLKHVANAEADVAFWNIAHPDERRTIDNSVVPAAVFTHPQIASVGLTEQAARADGRDIVVGRRAYGATAYGWALEDTTSFAKVLIDRASGLIVGAHILGPQAATLIQPLIQAMQFGQTAEQVARGQYWIHPALTEVVENALLEALQS